MKISNRLCVALALAGLAGYGSAAAVPVSDFWSYASGGYASTSGNSASLSVESLEGAVALATSVAPVAIHAGDSVVFDFEENVFPGLGGFEVVLQGLLPSPFQFYVPLLEPAALDGFNAGPFETSVEGQTARLTFKNDYRGYLGFGLLGDSVGMGPYASTTVSLSNIGIESPLPAVPEPSSMSLAIAGLALLALHWLRAGRRRVLV